MLLGLVLLGLSACGSLSDPDNIWNERREATGVADGYGVEALVGLTPGVFNGIGTGGFYGEVHVALTVDAAGSISNLEITYHGETPEFADHAFSTLIPGVLSAQSGNLDVVAGATRTSTAFLSAVADALNQAQE